jgi:hypothetical protein
MHYTYCHVSEKTNQIFYYGKGSGGRAYTKNCRNKKWHEIAKDGYKVEILAQWASHEEALDHEKFLIWCARDMALPLVNISGGGQGVLGGKHWLGKKHKPESLLKMSIAQKGQKRRKSVKFSQANAAANNPNWKGLWITPNGVFQTCRQVAEHYKIDTRTVRARCKGYKEVLVNSVKFYPPKTGWSFEPKE